MPFENAQLKDILLAGSYITPEDMVEAERFAESRHTSVTEYLYTKGLLTNELLGQAIAEYYKIEFADLRSATFSREQVMRIPEDVARTYRIVLFKEDKKRIVVATDEPNQGAGLKSALKNLFANRSISLAYALTSDIDQAYTYYRKDLPTHINEIVKQHDRVAPQIFQTLVEDAIAIQASDIHMEPLEKDVIIRMRMDGVLHEMVRVERSVFESILSHIKVLGRMRIDEHAAAQDGAIRFSQGQSHVDLRVSIIPVLDGEKVCIRVLSQYVRSFTLADLGLSSGNQELLLRAAKQPYGMILVVGPTGSGKSTTLYALIKYMSRPEINVTTIEDPVEYKMPGINQIQVNTQTNLTFAKGLRSIARQDPNIILVGEIRDQETAEIAVNAALTGHLLFSTFHANDAATAIPRLLEMGAEPFLLASTMNLLVAQRLVRKICGRCRYAVKVTREELEHQSPILLQYFTEEVTTLYKGKGEDCQMCKGTGYKGRTAVYECIYVSPEMRDLMLKRPSSQQIWELARSQGAQTLFDDGMEKVHAGITTLEEVFRVAPPPVKATS